MNPVRTRQPWTPEEEAKLIELYKRGSSLYGLCDAVGRKPLGVLAKIGALFLSARDEMLEAQADARREARNDKRRKARKACKAATPKIKRLPCGTPRP